MIRRLGAVPAMKPARLAVLGIAILAGCGAALLMSGEEAPPPPAAVVQPAAAPPIPTSEVLIAAAELPMGQVLKREDLRWMPWPEQALTPGMIDRRTAPNALEETVGSILRFGLAANEPIRSERLVKAGSGFMSVILPPGMRAVAITTDTRGSNTAGGFILPNDHVDIIKTSTEGGEQFAETLLTDIRVLAIGQVVQDKGGTSVVTADTATLAVTPSQAEAITLAQKTGQLSLVLRSIQDSHRTASATDDDASTEGGMTVVRFGVAKQQRR